jgi:formylglycine-generating enzyme required for sulfatase activity
LKFEIWNLKFITVKFLLTNVLSVVISTVAIAQSSTTFATYEQNIPGTAMKFKMVAIPAGQFNMGSSLQDPSAEKDEKPSRKVDVSAFWMGAYEVSRDEFNLFFEDESVALNSAVDAVTRPTSQYIDLTWGMGKFGGFPANSMQQFTALMYCRWLYEKTGVFYRLPTEAEWEYACRAGATTIYPFGNNAKDLKKYAWFKENSNAAYHKIGTLLPNAWGLYDMLGNVAEWTLDQYDETFLSKIKDGSKDPISIPTTRHPKLVKGGSYEDLAVELRPANRKSWKPEWNRRDPQIPKSRWWLTDGQFVGFRVVRPFKQPSPKEIDEFFKKHLGQ